MWLNIFMIFFFTFINGIFAMCEIAFVSLNDNKIKVRANEGDKKSIMLYHLLSDSNRFLSTLQIAITFAGFLNSAFASDAFADTVGGWLLAIFPGVSFSVIRPVSMVIITLLLSYVSLVLGELVPKRIGMIYSEQVAYGLVGFINLFSIIFKPIVSLLSLSTNLIVKILGIDPSAKTEEVTEEEIMMMIDVGQESGAILASEKKLITNIFEFNNTPVFDIMTHRKDMVYIDLSDDLAEIKEVLYNGKYSRIPVINDSIDDIIGVFNVKDLLHLDHKDDLTLDIIKKLMRKPTYIYESMECDELFFDMQKNKVHLAIVIDEYGGTAGLVTMEDLIEEIMGNIFDEYDLTDSEDIIAYPDGHYMISGDVSLDNVENLIYADLPLDEYDTLSGFVVGEMGRLPEQSDVGFEIKYHGYSFRIVKVENKYVAKVSIRKVISQKETD